MSLCHKPIKWARKLKKWFLTDLCCENGLLKLILNWSGTVRELTFPIFNFLPTPFSFHDWFWSLNCGFLGISSSGNNDSICRQRGNSKWLFCVLVKYLRPPNVAFVFENVASVCPTQLCNQEFSFFRRFRVLLNKNGVFKSISIRVYFVVQWVR